MNAVGHEMIIDCRELAISTSTQTVETYDIKKKFDKNGREREHPQERVVSEGMVPFSRELEPEELVSTLDTAVLDVVVDPQSSTTASTTITTTAAANEQGTNLNKSTRHNREESCAHADDDDEFEGEQLCELFDDEEEHDDVEGVICGERHEAQTKIAFAVSAVSNENTYSSHVQQSAMSCTDTATRHVSDSHRDSDINRDRDRLCVWKVVDSSDSEDEHDDVAKGLCEQFLDDNDTTCDQDALIAPAQTFMPRLF